VIKEIAKEAELKIAEPPGLWPKMKRLFGWNVVSPPGEAIHELGGARMGTDPSNSVLNKYNQCWDAENLFVTDGACFVSTGCQNSTLTIMALSVRACEHIARQMMSGEL
jgi:choline dehydrogenase-like flavoprotein